MSSSLSSKHKTQQQQQSQPQPQQSLYDSKKFKQGSLFSFFSTTAATKSGSTVEKKSSKSNDGKHKSSTNDGKGGIGDNHSTNRTDNSNATFSTKETTVTAPSIATNTQWRKLQTNMRIAVYWKDDKQYYPCTVMKQHSYPEGMMNSNMDISDNSSNSGCRQFHLRYDDGEEEEFVDMGVEQFKFIDDDEHLNDDDDHVDEEKSKIINRNSRNSRSNGAKRRLSIHESDSDEEEQEPEWKEDVVEEDDDQWMVTDDEEEENDHDDDDLPNMKRINKRKHQTKTKVTLHQRVSANDDEEVKETSSVTPNKAKRLKTKTTSKGSTVCTDTMNMTGVVSADFTTPLKLFTHQVSPRTASSHKSSVSSSAATSATIPSRTLTPVTSTASKITYSRPQTSSPSSNNKLPLPFVKGVVNVRGAHVHNHLPFLQNPKDAKDRSPDHPQYDARTLKVVEKDWINLNNGSEMTAAVKQWWDLKSQYYDTILLFKTGKFYELYHMDADVGVDVLGLIYMKGHVAHCGFPEAAYAKYADQLVRAGYKVARVEQTETPEQLNQRKQKMPRSSKNKPKVVNREVCSILTLGTRTLCALDNGSGSWTEASSTSAAEGMGPLLAIREVVVVTNHQEDQTTHNTDGERMSQDDDSVQPVCEYGITLVDAIRGTITLGMFADDVLRSQMHTLLTSFAPSEILVQGGGNSQHDAASPTLLSLLKAYATSSRYPCRIETIHQQETFPKSTALELEHRKQLERQRSIIQPWDVQETLNELHRKRYFPRASRRADNKSIARWPPVLQAVVQGDAKLCLSSFGAALYYLQRNLIDQEILTMGIVKAYIPQPSPAIQQQALEESRSFATGRPCQETQPSPKNGKVTNEDNANVCELEQNPLFQVPDGTTAAPLANGEENISYMSLDGTTLHNLEILTNSVDFKVSGSLWSKLNHTKCPHGSRMLRAWLLRPLFRKADIDRRADAVQALVGGAGALALREARQAVFIKIGDLDRLLSRVHSMSVGVANLNGVDPDQDEEDDAPTDYHPAERAVLYETPTYTKRKVADFSKLLNGLRKACQLPELFRDMDLDPNGLLFKFVRVQKDGGLFPDMEEVLDWFFENFDCDKAEKGLFEPVRGCDPIYDQACDTIQRVKEDLEAFKDEMCKELAPRHLALSSWKYINTKVDSKDKYLIELPVQVDVPNDFLVKGKRGSGAKQVNKYTTPVVAGLIKELEKAYDVQQVRKARGMQAIFAKFDAQRSLWSAAAHVTAVLDALGSLAIMAENPGYCRAKILECPSNKQPSLTIIKGRHPVVEKSFHSSDFIPNDLNLGPQENAGTDSARMLLLSGPNMGGKSTMLRQTCLIAILAQIGSYVPAESCQLTPVDCIFTRLGASDRILLGQSTFFVELAETAAALRGATRRSLVIMDELGRGTSTFDGTAIASATVKHLVQRSQCMSLFATHYHSLLEEWKDAPNVRLGHMQCIVDEMESETCKGNSSITFLYTLGAGACPKSFGINVARLAGLPDEVLATAKRVSQEFEEEINGVVSTYEHNIRAMTEEEAQDHVAKLKEFIEIEDSDNLQCVWDLLRITSE